ncbi:MAG: SIS domain-containing protein [Patescibacteria group bacterium]
MPTPFPALLKQLDPQDVFGSVERFARQGHQAVSDIRALKFPALRGKVDTILLAGMGGSALGAHIIQAACSQELRVPLVIINDYQLPAWVGKRTLVILASYSGTTEETIAAWQPAKKSGARVAVIAAGGQLGRIAKTNKLPAYIFNPIENPSKQPRLGLGYAVFGLLGMLRKMGLLDISPTILDDALKVAERTIRRTDLRSATSPIVGLSAALQGRAVYVTAAEHLVGAAHAMANQFNETAKSVAIFFAIPELNHHLMEGLGNPKANVKQTTFLMLQSALYSPRIQKRFRLTADVVQKNGAKVISIRLTGRTALAQAIEALVLGGALTLGVGLRHHVNPSEIHWVNYFKQKLGT